MHIQKTPLEKRLFVQRAKVGIFRPTAGTSGQGMMIIPRAESENSVAPTAVEMYRAGKVKKLATMSSAHFRFSHVLQKIGIQTIALDPSDLKGSAEIVHASSPDMISGYTFTMNEFLGNLNMATRDNIKTIQLYSERVSNAQLSHIRAQLPNAAIYLDYSSMESQMQIAASCPFLAGSFSTSLHPIREFFYFETIDKETMLPVSPENGGELVITSLIPCAFPLIRYRTGDFVKFKEKKCECGRKSILNIEGRVQRDRLHILKGELTLPELERVTEQLTPLLTRSDYEVRYRDVVVGGIPRIEITFFLDWSEYFTDAPFLANRIAQLLRVAPNRTYADGVRAKEYAPLRVERLARVNSNSKYARLAPYESNS
jgi:phenylacetate-coenzyme A ligase PaaK-like adenylate-forming protein